MQTLTRFGSDAYVNEDYMINLNTAVLTTNVKPLRFPNDSVVYIYKSNENYQTGRNEIRPTVFSTQRYCQTVT